MRRFQYTYLFIIFSVLLGPIVLEGQIEDRNTSEQVFCINNDYLFLIEGNYYSEGSKVYVCPKNLASGIDIGVVDANTLAPVNYTFQWDNFNETSSTINILDTNFNGNDDELKLLCEFTTFS